MADSRDAMSQTTSGMPFRPRRRRRWRLIAIGAGLILALMMAWVIREARRASVRRTVLPELAGVGVEPTTFGLTAPGLAATLTLGHEGGERWLRDHLGEGWFSRPVEFRATKLEDEQVGYAVERLRRLGKVYAIQVPHGGLTNESMMAISDGLPGADIVMSRPSGEIRIPARPRRLFRW